MRQSIQTLTTLLCNDLLVAPGDAPISHLIVNIPLAFTSGLYRVGYDSSIVSVNFVVARKQLLCSYLTQPDSEMWAEPELVEVRSFKEYEEAFGPAMPPESILNAFRSLAEYQGHFPDKPIPPVIPWPMILFNFGSVEVIRDDPKEPGVVEVISGTGPELAARPDIEALLLTLG